MKVRTLGIKLPKIRYLKYKDEYVRKELTLKTNVSTQMEG
jgi:hypothetical protein